MGSNTLLLVDGSGLLFQMFYGMPARIVGKNGKPVQAVVGFIGALLKVIRQMEPTHVLVVFDGETGNFRSELSADYKANRPDFSAMPEEETPFSQMPDIKRVLDRLGILHYEVTEDREADDIIASYALSVGGQDKAVILSQDKDCLQLVSDRVSVFCYRGKQSILYDEKAVIDKFGVAPRFFSDFKALMGDPSDNIRGLPGIGPKTAAELIRQFGSVTDLLSHVEDIQKPSVRKTVSEHTDTLLLNKQLVTLSGDAPVPYSFDKLVVDYASLPETAEALRSAGIIYGDTMFSPIVSLIEQYDTVILHRHSSPDGDALGSQIGLSELIRTNYPEKTVYTVGDDTGRYAFMAGSTMDTIPDETFAGALAIVLDSGSASLVSDTRYALAAATARIDHHIFSEAFTGTEVVDTSFESCCGMITALAIEAGWILSLPAATALYTGMVTDSGRFRYDCVTSGTFRRAAFLLEQPIDIGAIFSDLYADDYSRIKLRAEFTLKVRFTEKNVAYIYTTKEEMADIPADVFTVSRGMVGVMSDIRGVDIWVNFTETDTGVLCEIRSSRYNINPIAVRYGGGGHAKASGATLPDRDTAMALLKDLDKLTEDKHE